MSPGRAAPIAAHVLAALDRLATKRDGPDLYLAEVERSGEPEVVVGSLAEIAERHPTAARLVGVNLNRILDAMRDRAAAEGIDMADFWTELTR
jgi:hypothetical protein